MTATTTTEPRKWTATITIGDETIPADCGQWDTLRESTDAALREAREYVKAGFGSEASVTMYKQLKNDAAPVIDRPGGYVYIDAAGHAVINRW